jgi:hypothetical protein
LRITKYGEERRQEEGFSELVSTLLASGDVEGAKIFVGVALAGNAMGEIDGTFDEFKDFMNAAGDDILSCLGSGAARC